jgi:hypothetical protein
MTEEIESARRIQGAGHLSVRVETDDLGMLYLAEGCSAEAADLLDHHRRAQSPSKVDMAVTSTNLGLDRVTRKRHTSASLAFLRRRMKMSPPPSV